MNDSCDAERKCWEHWRGWYARADRRALLLALDYMFLRADEAKRKGQMQNLSISFPEKLEEACAMYDTLAQRQWCEMNEKPFIFKIPEALVRPAPITLSTLMDVL